MSARSHRSVHRSVLARAVTATAACFALTAAVTSAGVGLEYAADRRPATPLGVGGAAVGAAGLSPDALAPPVSLDAAELTRRTGRAGSVPYLAVRSVRSDEIPWRAYVAYQQASLVLGDAAPGCRLDWSVLAALGRVASDHGRSDGGELAVSTGVVRPALVGAALNGRQGRDRAPDTDRGSLDRDQRWDRAVGALQVTPERWSVVGIDGDGDGRRNPQDLDDASLAVGVLLCAPGRDLDRPAALRRVLDHVNTAPGFAGTVIRLARQYDADGAPADTSVTAIPEIHLPDYTPPNDPAATDGAPSDAATDAATDAASPTATPTEVLTAIITGTPLPTPTATPTATSATDRTTEQPTSTASAEPTDEPTTEPTGEPTGEPSCPPTPTATATATSTATATATTTEVAPDPTDPTAGAATSAPTALPADPCGTEPTDAPAEPTDVPTAEPSGPSPTADRP